MSVHRFVQDLKFYRLMPILRTRGKLGEGRSRLSVECTSPTLVSISSSPSPLSAKLCSMSVHRSVQKLEFYRIISRPRPISHSRGTLGRTVVGCPSNAHPQLWCLSTPLHHLCLLNFVPLVCIDLFKV